MDEDTVTELNNFLDFDSAKKETILNNLINDNILKITKNNVIITDDIYKDTNIDKWCDNLPILNGGKIFMNKLIKNPINDINLLKLRQNTYIPNELDIEILKDYENDVLWVFKIASEITDNSAINILFPSTFIINYINYIEPILDFYHLYKIFLIPLTSILYPISTFLAPYYYLNQYMKLNISFQQYFNIFIEILKFSIQTTGNIKADLIKFITLFLYVAIYLYNMYQTYEMASLLYDIKYKLHGKMEGLINFVNHSKYILSSVSDKIIEPYFNLEFFKGDIQISNCMSDIYRLWKDDGYLKNNIISMIKSIYAIDAINSICNLKNNYNDKWSICNYETDKTVILDAKNPLLSNSKIKQVENPVNLSKNIIITGPNAGGKTTYVKTILTNIILSHTFGICYSIKSDIVLYDTIYSFMRLTDILGSKSYFEVEAEYCSKMIKEANQLYKNNKKGLFLMDEPMHSTPPIEGMSTAYAVAEHLSKLDGIYLIITTHFHKLIILEELYPDKFINISVDAIKKEIGFYFPYKIKKGHSYQCIAIELLNSKDFPSNVIQSAINMKNKICGEIIK
jgi:hypothetical protein